MNQREEAMKYLNKYERALLRTWWRWQSGDVSWANAVDTFEEISDAVLAEEKVEKLADPEEE